MANHSELISVIIPIYNAERYLQHTIESVLVQTYSHFELILVNDGSTDGSLSICKIYQAKDERVRIVDSENRGASQARNIGIAHARGHYLSFLDSDDLWEPEFLQYLYARIKASPEIKLVYSGSDERMPDGRVLRKITDETEGYFDAFTHKLTGEFNVSFNMDSFLVERELLAKYHIEFNPAYKISEDVGFFLKLLCVEKAYAVPVVLAHYIRQENSATTSVWKHENWESTVLLFDDARPYCEQHYRDGLPAFERMRNYRIYRYVLSVFRHGEVDAGMAYIEKYRIALEDFSQHGGKIGDRMKCRLLLLSNRRLLLWVYGKNRSA